MEKEIYTTKEASDYLQVSERTILEYIKNKVLPAVKIGKGWRIRIEALRSFTTAQ